MRSPSGVHATPSVSKIIYSQALAMLGTPYTQATTSAFASGMHLRFPIVALLDFVESVPVLSESASIGSVLLLLAMHLLELRVPQSRLVEQIPEYVAIKQIIGLLETTSYRGLRVLQSKILIMLFELGHGLLIAASISLGACTRTARAMGLRDLGSISNISSLTAHELEERRRVWWGLFTIDRFINGCVGDAMFGMPDPKSTDRLPYTDRIWIRQRGGTEHPTVIVASCLDSPFDKNFGQFGRECQIAHLAGRVFRHAFDAPAGDKAFQMDEALQLERTLWSFLPLLGHAGLEFGRFCAALAIGCNALFVLYEHRSHVHTQERITDADNALAKMDQVADHVVYYSKRCYDERDIDYATISPYIPLSLYQAAVVRSRKVDSTGSLTARQEFNALKRILGLFGQRWNCAAMYLDALSSPSPAMMPPQYPDTFSQELAIRRHLVAA